MKYSIFFLVGFVFLIPFAFAIPINDTTLYASALNSTINISSIGWVADGITVDSNFIYVSNLTSSNPHQVSNYPFTFNFTAYNKKYWGTDAPYWTYIGTNQAIFFNNMSGLIGDIEMSVNTCKINEVLFNGNKVPFSCSGTKLGLHNISFMLGQNTIRLKFQGGAGGSPPSFRNPTNNLNPNPSNPKSSHSYLYLALVIVMAGLISLYSAFFGIIAMFIGSLVLVLFAGISIPISTLVFLGGSTIIIILRKIR